LKSKIDFVQLQDSREEEVDALVEEQQNTGFQQSYEQTWRLLTAYTCDQITVSEVFVFFVVNEAFKDRLCGGIAFHRSFLAALLLANGVNPSSQQTRNHSLFSSVRPLSKMPPPRSNTALTSQSRLKTITFGTEETTRLIEVSSSNRTNLTGVIQATIVASLFANLPSEITTLYSEGRISPQELHSLGGTMENPDAISCVSHLETHKRHELTMASVWNDSRHIHSATKAELAGKKSKSEITSWQERKGSNKVVGKDAVEEGQVPRVIVSNMGYFRDRKQSKSQQQETWRAESIICGNGSTAYGTTLSVTLVVGGNGCLTMGFSWSDDIFEEVWLDRVISTLKRIVGELLFTSDTMKATRVSDALPWGGSMSRLVYLVRDLMLE
jgi:hypothetical protein